MASTKLTNRLAEPGEHPALARPMDHSASPVVNPYPRTMSGYRTCAMASGVFCADDGPEPVNFADSEAPTLGGVDRLESLLALTLHQVGERDSKIRMLERQIELLSSRGPIAREVGEAPLAVFEPAPAQRAANTAPCTPSDDAERSGNVVRWHAVTIGGPAPDEQVALPSTSRKDVRPVAELQVVFDLDTQFYTGLSQDFSEGGVFIATYQPQPIGTQLGLSFELPCGTKIVARGEVRWIRDTLDASRPGMGVAFVKLSTLQLNAIARACHQRAPLLVEF